MIGWSPKCYISSFVEIGPTVPEKKIFDGFLPYVWRHLVQVTSIMSSGFQFLVPESFHTKFCLDKTVVSETSSPKGNDRSPENKQVFLNSSLVSKRFFQLVKGSQLCSPWLTKF